MVRLTKNIDECVKSIQKGEVVVFPTETVYGMGANIYNESAVNKIFDYKNRPKSKPLIVHINNFDQVLDLTSLEGKELDFLKDIMSKLSPGPISFLLPKSDKVPNYVTGNSPNVCVRIPSNETALELLKKVNTPICAPSANLYCHASPTCAKHILEDFFEKDFLVLDDIYNDTVIGIESTIVEIDFKDRIINILRPGFITPSMLCAIYQEFDFRYKMDNTVPGSTIKHYSINKDIRLIQTHELIEYLDFKNSSLIEFGNIFNNMNFSNYYSLSLDKNYIEAMQRFYTLLRKSENDESKYIYIYFPRIKDENHFYTSLFDRIIKCVNGNILTLQNLKQQNLLVQGI